MTRTTVTGAYDQGTFGALERLPAHVAERPGAPRECFWRIVARRSVLAAGAIERPVAFANNDRPGVMTAASVRAYVNRWRVSPGRSIAVFGNSDNAHRTAADLLAAGVHVSALVDSRLHASTDLDVPFHPGARVCNVHGGRGGVEAITIATAGGHEKILADCLAVSGGWNPNVHLSCHMNARPVWDPDIAAFVPAEGAVPGLVPAGACRGEFSTRACLEGGIAAAAEALQDLGLPMPDIAVPPAEDEAFGILPLWRVPGKGRAWLDFQNDVTVKDVEQAAAENFRSVEHMKRYTTQGMATDQGKTSNVGALAVLAERQWQRHPRNRNHHLPAALRTGKHRGNGRGRAGHGLRAAADDNLARGFGRARRPDAGSGAVVPARLLSRAGRDSLAAVLRPRGARRAGGGRGRRCLDTGQDRHPGSGCGCVPGFRLYQHVLDAEAGDARDTGSCCARTGT